jgi:aminopeptidase
MPDLRIETWAAVLAGYSTDVQPGETVAITGGVAAEPLLRAISRAVLARGAHPVLLPTFSDATADLLAHASDEQLHFISPMERFVRAEADVMIAVSAGTNTKNLSGVDPARQAVWNRARTTLMETSMRRAASGERRWSSTLYPTPAYAQDAAMATDDFADFVFAACKLNDPDPIAAWRRVSAEQARLIDRLAGKAEIHILGPDTDLTLSVAGRIWINSDGHRNFPSGEIFTGPVEDSATGQIRFTYPIIAGGREVADVRLRFEAGVVVEATAAQNEEYLLATLDTDPGARRLGEFAFGTNTDITRFTKNILLDEKMGGTIHMALGAGYPDSGSQNRSAIHWDLICDLRPASGGGRVDVDGAPFLQDGRYLV